MHLLEFLNTKLNSVKQKIDRWVFNVRLADSRKSCKLVAKKPEQKKEHGELVGFISVPKNADLVP